MLDKLKVVFLDCDGVLNYTQWYVSDRNPGNLYGQEGDIDPECIQRVLKICNTTGAKIVISSDWRISWPGAKIRLEKAGFPEGLIIDKTPEFIWRNLSKSDYFDENYEETYEYSRGSEIDEWIKNHPETYDYVILDDREDFTKEQKWLHYIHVNPYCGLTDDDTDKAIEILSR